jgi:hypothetical protein
MAMQRRSQCWRRKPPTARVGRNLARKRLARINIAHPYDYCRIHDEVLDRFVQSPGPLQEIGTGKCLREGLWPQMRQARMLEEVRFAGQKSLVKKHMPKRRVS